MNTDALALLTGTSWAMEEDALKRLTARVQAATTINLQASAGSGRASMERREDVAVLPLTGVLSWRPGPLAWLFGETSVEEFVSALRFTAEHRSVKAIVLDVDSPGGSTDGIPEAADAVRRVARVKPVVAVANTVMASAAYWIASQAGQVIGSPSSLTGSIGIYGMHVDESGALGKAGLRVTYISAGKYKVEGNPAEPLGDVARSHFQETVDDAYRMFVEDVAIGRGATRAQVIGGFGEGRALHARPALAARLIDRIGTLDSVTRAATSSARQEYAFQHERRMWAGDRRPTPYEQERRRRGARIQTAR